MRLNILIKHIFNVRIRVFELVGIIYGFFKNSGKKMNNTIDKPMVNNHY